MKVVRIGLFDAELNLVEQFEMKPVPVRSGGDLPPFRLTTTCVPGRTVGNPMSASELAEFIGQFVVNVAQDGLPATVRVEVGRR